MHLPDRDAHFDHDRQTEESRKQPQHERDAAKEFCSGRKIGHPGGQAERGDRIHVMVKSFEYLAVAVRDHDRAQGEPHDKLRERLQPVQEIEIQAHPRK